MLEVDVRELRRGPVLTEGVLAAGDPGLGELDLALAGPVQVSGRLQGAPARSTFTWQGRVEARIRGECRRCLTEVVAPVWCEIEAIFTADPDTADDPAAYPLSEPVTRVSVLPAVREELLLAAPAFMLCRDSCAGLCPRCGADLNVGPCGCAAPPEPD